MENFKNSNYSDLTLLSYDMYMIFEENAVNYQSAQDTKEKNIFLNKMESKFSFFYFFFFFSFKIANIMKET